MRRPVVMLLVVLLTLPFSARAADDAPAVAHERGAVSALGLALLIGGAASLGLGVSGLIGVGDASTVLNAFPTPLPAAEAASYKATDDRLSALRVLSAVSLVASGLLFAGGIVCIVADAPTKVSVTLFPTHDGAYASVSLRF